MKNYKIVHLKRVTLWYGNYMSIKLLFIYFFKKPLIRSPARNNKNMSPGICTGWNYRNNCTSSGAILGGVRSCANSAGAQNQYGAGLWTGALWEIVGRTASTGSVHGPG